jgi:hypothetical protein
MNLSENTYGNTPAALYLVRVLNAYDNAAMTRNAGKRITASSKCVNELVDAYQFGALTAKTVANCLRLMRSEIAVPAVSSFQAPSPERLIEQLVRNVQIGLIKKAMRLCTISRKAERVMENPDMRAARYCHIGNGNPVVVKYSFVDSETSTLYVAGEVVQYEGREPVTYNKKFQFKEINDVTAELLMERSNRRCLRQGKPHMVK